MTERTYKVGDVVPWSLCGTIPWGTLLAYRKGWTALRAGNGGFLWVQIEGKWDYSPRLWLFGGLMEEGCRWDTVEGSATIVALGLDGQANANDLQRLAEEFEVLTSPLVAAVGMLIERGQAQTRGTVGDALHAAGSRVAHDIREVQVRRDRSGLYLWIQSTDGRAVLLTDTGMLRDLAAALSRAGLGHKQLELEDGGT